MNTGNPFGNKRKQKSPQRRYSVWGTVWRCLVVVLAATFVVVASYIIIHCIKTVHGDKFDLDLYKTDQEQTSIIYINEHEQYGEKFDSTKFTEYKRLHGETNRIWIDLESIPKDMQNAIISLEDKRFKDHHGVDWFRTLSVMLVSSNYGQGGSTITQQLIKNITNKKEVTFVRKFNEILTALNLERNYSKDDILETYLNTLYLGEGCYGIKTAAEVYFGKEVEDLTLAECAVLASITQAPGTYDPLINRENNAERKNFCLSNMLDQGYITEEEYNQAKNERIIFSDDDGFVSHLKDDSAALEKEEVQSFYVDYIISSLIDDFMNEYDMTYNQAYKKVYYGGLKIYSAENILAQNIIEEGFETRNAFPTVYTTSSTGEPAQASMTVMDYNGRVLCICGAADKKAGNRCLNRATDSPRQPGSSIKGLSCYAPAIENKIITAGSSELDYPDPERGMWPLNYGGSYGSNSYVSVSYALQESLNTVPYRIIKKMGLQVSYDFLKNKVHLGHLVDGEDDRDYAPVSVGAMYYGVTSLELTAGYAIFGSGGKYYKPYPYFKVVNSKGDTYFDNTNPEGEQAISPSCAEVMNRLLQKVVTQGTGMGYSIGRYDTFAKTGTTSSNLDRWIVGGTPYFVSAVWFGFDMPAEISTSASNPAGQIFKYVMDRIHEKLDLPYRDYDFVDKPQAELKRYCAYTGKLAGDSCYYTDVAYFTSEYDIYCDGNHSGRYTADTGEDEEETTEEETWVTEAEVTEAEDNTSQSGGDSPKTSEKSNDSEGTGEN